MDAAAQAPGQLAGVQLLARRRCGDECFDGGFVGGAGCYPGEGDLFAGYGGGGGLPAQQGAGSPGGAAGVCVAAASAGVGAHATAPEAGRQGPMGKRWFHDQIRLERNWDQRGKLLKSEWFACWRVACFALWSRVFGAGGHSFTEAVSAKGADLCKKAQSPHKPIFIKTPNTNAAMLPAQ